MLSEVEKGRSSLLVLSKAYVWTTENQHRNNCFSAGALPHQDIGDSTKCSESRTEDD